MPAFVVMLLGGLASMLAGLVPRILLSLGIGFATFTGITVALDSLKAQLLADLQGLPATVVGVLALLRLDQGVSLVVSATLAVMATKAIGGALTRITMKGVA
ncbi:MAG: head virion protein [Inoviridae sp. ctBZ32]|nr:MAG: head virion protein [Inoviridae sp. ctBZ32]